MSVSFDTRPLSRRVNRAVAALAELDVALTHAPLLSPPVSALPPRPVVRYASWAALLSARAVPDPHDAARAALCAAQPPPPRRNAFDAMGDAALRRVFALLGPFSADAARLAAVCRRLRRVAVEAVPPRAVLSPDMFPPAALSVNAAAVALVAYFGGRGRRVRALRLLSAPPLAAVPLPAASPLLLGVVPRLPYLRALDLRGVRWAGGPSAVDVLGALHLAAPCLGRLGIGSAIAARWPPGWWQRHAALVELRVGSRREEAGQAAVLPLHEDFFVMLRAPQREWRIKLWCAIERDALARLLTPSVAFPELLELTVNASNVDILDEVKRPGSQSLKDTRRKTLKKAPQPSEDGDPRALFPTLESLVVANLDQCPTMQIALLDHMAARAPKLKNFTIVNTTRIPPPPKTRRRMLLAEPNVENT